ncbi:thioredoxin M4 chloroplastic-like [Trifolium medium]|uniref:Thioredoxin M4 chloroplastic-like n=2 Tax=Trifolium medium TaxID=97028 RepID=A0A392QX91_9FABA|nr:thioredoxin M4 chloroplastic-like [Trifolium medium]MCI28973.1 thioredoxin M4 chloroplastic-like [Trifolium medium]
MATILESIALVTQPSSAISPVVAHRSSPKFPRYVGLRPKPKPRPIFSTHFAASPTSRIASRTSRVVCEAQDTAVDGQFSFSLHNFCCNVESCPDLFLYF